MIELETQDWDEHVKLLREAEESVVAMGRGDGEKEMEKSRRALVSFHTTAAMLGLDGLEKVGMEMEAFLSGNVSPDFSMDSVASLSFGLSSLIDGVNALKEGKGNHEAALEEIREILRPSSGEAGTTSGAEGVEQSERAAGEEGNGPTEMETACRGEADFENLREIVRNLGGEFMLDCDDQCGARFKISFTGSADTLRKIEQFICDGESLNGGACRAVDESLVQTVVGNVNDIIDAISSADMDSAQKILLKLADQSKPDAGLYKEIGGLARGLHDSILSFLNTLDPSLQEIVTDKIPDSGNRLEHILEMTEKAALTTLDHVESIQDRLSEGKTELFRLREVLGGLKAVGDSAGKKLAQSLEGIDAMEQMIAAHRSDLDIIMGAQDYQDLSGQVIQKIIKLLKDIEGKLVNIIKTFGVKAEAAGEKKIDELYGPAHAGLENAVHSQDEVDSLLSEFGF